MDLLNGCCAFTVGGVILVLGTAAYFVFGRKWKLPKDYTKWKTKDYPKDVVLLHQMARGPFAPSLSPFPVKLETYLRIARIPYKNVHSIKMGPKGKFPWMEYNGDVVSDSEFCISYLNCKLGVDLNKHLSVEQKAVARMLQRMVDEHVYWTGVLHRWVTGNEWKTLLLSQIPRHVIWYVRRMMKDACFGQGIGRYTPDEVEHMVQTDLQTLSHFLGNKQYMMGDELSEVDCAVFGELSQVRWQLQGSPGERIIKEQKNLVEYLDRIKEKVWPDWDDCTTKGGTTEATA